MNQNELDKYYRIIEEVISGLGVPIDECRSVDQSGKTIPGQWNLTKGSAKIFVDVYMTDEGMAYFCIASPVMEVHVPDTRKLYERLLEINHCLYGASFSIDQGWVWLRTIRECEGMDITECRNTFDRVGWYADRYDDELKKEFGG